MFPHLVASIMKKKISLRAANVIFWALTNIASLGKFSRGFRVMKLCQATKIRHLCHTSTKCLMIASKIPNRMMSKDAKTDNCWFLELSLIANFRDDEKKNVVRVSDQVK